MGRLEGKVAVISGAAQGIGAIMAQALSEAGAKVLVTDVQDTAKAVQRINDAGGTAQGMKVDVTNNDDLAAMVETAKSMGGLDIMVNNAGVMYYTFLKNMREEDWENEIDTNIKGVVNGVG